MLSTSSAAGRSCSEIPVHLLRQLPGIGAMDSVFRPFRSGSAQSRRDRKLRIGNFLTFQGSPGIWGPASTNASLLALAEINKRGGILGREVDICFYEAGEGIEDVTRRAADAILHDNVDVIMGSHISAVRLALRKVTRNRVPYVYTPVYEGGERTPGVMAIGETPYRQSRPAIAWMADVKKARRWYLIGSDYVWPWQSHLEVKKYIAETGGTIVGEEFVPVGDSDHEPQLARIRAARPDVALISLIGTDSITFNRAFGECGLGRTTLRLAGAMDETVLLGIGADNTENLYCASGYFGSVASRANDEFLSSYRGMFGRYAPPIGSVAQSNYEGLRFLEAAANRAGCLAIGPLSAAAQKLQYRGARGLVSISGGEATMSMHFAEADGLDFRLVKTF